MLTASDRSGKLPIRLCILTISIRHMAQKTRKAIFRMEDGQACQSVLTGCFRLRIYQMMTAIPIIAMIT